MKMMTCLAVVLITVVQWAMGGEPKSQFAKEDALSTNPERATNGVQVLKEHNDSKALLDVVKKGRVHPAKLCAIDALGGMPENAEALVDILEAANATVVEGGSEQQSENREIKRALMSSIGRICRIGTPQDTTVQSTSTFISTCRVCIQETKRSTTTPQPYPTSKP